MALLLLVVCFFSGQGSSENQRTPEWKVVGQSLAADFSYDAHNIDKLPDGYVRVQFRLV